jgi:hypothetical protein
MLMYFGIHQPREQRLSLPEGVRFSAEVIDTWNMTIEQLPGVYSGEATIRLPGRPYIALRLRKAT